MKKILLPLACLFLIPLACSNFTPSSTPTPVDRLAAVTGAKIQPETDAWVPIAAVGWSAPEPLPYPVNTAGGEDSPFITADGSTLYFFFTPDVSIPAEKQLTDGLTGIWAAQQTGGTWSVPRRVLLQDTGKVALDGCPFVMGSELWFCSARQGNYRSVDIYTASLHNGERAYWQNAGKLLNETFQTGEMHLSADGQELYFASTRPGGYGGYDLWVSRRSGDSWTEPVNLGAEVNSSGDENRPFLSADGNALWFDAPSRSGKPGPAIYVSTRRADGTWGAPSEVISQFAAEPTLTADGKKLFFVHHFFPADMSRMLEADIYLTTHP